MEIVYGYCRDYSQQSSRRSKSVREQEELIRAYCSEMSLGLNIVFVDELLTPPIQLHPGLSKLFTSLGSSHVKKAVVYNLEVLTSDDMLQEKIIDEFTQIDVELISVADPNLGKSDPTRTLMKEVLLKAYQMPFSLHGVYSLAAREMLGRKAQSEG